MQNISMFELTYPRFQIKKPVRLIELFAGVGSQAMALRNIGVKFEHHKVIEFDKFAIASYNAIHGTNFKTTDITETKGEDLEIINTDKHCYILTYSFPCQDLSLAGNRGGMSKGSGTRSGLLWEVERLLNEVGELPQVLLMENVPQVLSQANIQDFHSWQQFLERKGYKNYTDTLNAKDYKVAQNRNRTFMVSILGDYYYRFPVQKDLTKAISDYLENEVEEKYYINSLKAKTLISKLVVSGQLKGSVGNVNPSGNGINGEVYGEKGLCPTLTTNKGEDQKICVDLSVNNPKVKSIANCITARHDRGISNQQSVGAAVVERNKKPTEVKQVGNIAVEKNFKNPQTGRVYSSEGLCPTLNTMQGGQREPKIIEHTIVASRGRNPKNPSDRTAGIETEQRLEPNSQGVCNTITTVQKDNMVLETVKIKQATQKGYVECKLGGVADLSYPESKTRRGRVQEGGEVSPTITATETGIHKIESPYRIRKLTPKECWRLMGFTDEDFHKAEEVNSNTQLYKQAGNSIVTNVLEEIFKQML